MKENKTHCDNSDFEFVVTGNDVSPTGSATLVSTVPERSALLAPYGVNTTKVCARSYNKEAVFDCPIGKTAAPKTRKLTLCPHGFHGECKTFEYMTFVDLKRQLASYCPVDGYYLDSIRTLHDADGEEFVEFTFINLFASDCSFYTMRTYNPVDIAALRLPDPVNTTFHKCEYPYCGEISVG